MKRIQPTLLGLCEDLGHAQSNRAVDHAMPDAAALLQIVPIDVPARPAIREADFITAALENGVVLDEADAGRAL